MPHLHRIRKPLKVIAAGLVLLSLTGFLWSRNRAEQRWRELIARVPVAEVPDAEITIKAGAVHMKMAPDGVQAGHFRLADGALWRFAFLPHAAGEEGLCVLQDAAGTWRVQGTAFCCEVALPEPPLADSAALLAWLRSGNSTVVEAD